MGVGKSADGSSTYITIQSFLKEKYRYEFSKEEFILILGEIFNLLNKGS